MASAAFYYQLTIPPLWENQSFETKRTRRNLFVNLTLFKYENFYMTLKFF